MEYPDLINKLCGVIHDVYTTDVEFTPIREVPNVNGNDGLTFESGDVKRGRTIKTCVLYVDIRDSIKLNVEAQTKTMGKIYTAFTKAVLLAARHEGGCVRNIIGDRVMIVFPEDNCFQRAVHCAFTINNIATLIDVQFPSVKFRCGIGIDYGTMNVLKVGIDVRDDEKQEYKNLVWVGYPANFASRLTDVANKTVVDRYKITGRELGRESAVSERTYSKEELLSVLHADSYRLHPWFFSTVSKIEPLEHTFPSILVSESVYNGYARDPHDDSIRKGRWKKQDYPIKDIKFPVYGTDTFWRVDS